MYYSWPWSTYIYNFNFYFCSVAPKKRKCLDAATKQGTGRQYFMDNLSDASGDNLLNGHVLYIHLL